MLSHVKKQNHENMSIVEVRFQLVIDGVGHGKYIVTHCGPSVGHVSDTDMLVCPVYQAQESSCCF